MSKPTDKFIAGVKTDWLITSVEAKLQIYECRSQITGLLSFKSNWCIYWCQSRLTFTGVKSTSQINIWYNVWILSLDEYSTCFSINCMMIVMFTVSSVYSGECCKEYYDVSFQLQPAQWCSDYCCHKPSTLFTTYYCCSNDILRAGADMRDSFCRQWWEHNM